MGCCLLWAALGCGSTEDLSCPAADVRSVTSAIVDGDDDADYLALGETDLDAFVRVRPERSLASEIPSCTGFAVGPRQVITSTHCLESGGLQIERAGDHSRVLAPNPIRHATLPVVLATLPDSAPAFASYFALALAPTTHLTAGDRVLVGGYGEDEDANLGRLLFAVEAIKAIHSDRIAITGHGEVGLCRGDSGAPMLARGDGGVVTALGVLAEGSSDCLGDDYFVPTSSIATWLIAHQVRASGTAHCGALSFEGRCFGAIAAWCESDTLKSDTCTGSTTCSWDDARNAFRCVAKDHDTCGGTDTYGRCQGDEAVQCNRGDFISFDCAQCEASCAYTPQGRPTCRSAQ